MTFLEKLEAFSEISLQKYIDLQKNISTAKEWFLRGACSGEWVNSKNTHEERKDKKTHQLLLVILRRSFLARRWLNQRRIWPRRPRPRRWTASQRRRRRRRRRGPGGLDFLGRTGPCTRLGGGKTADVLMWKDKKISAAVIGGATVIWVLFEVVDYHFLPLISHVLIGALAILFLWSKATIFVKKSPPDIPEVQISEDVAVNVALALRTDINQALGFLQEIALGHDLKKFLGVIVALWILSEFGSLCDFLTLIYVAVLMLHTVPILYHKYQDKVDHFAGKAHVELCKQYEVLDAKVLSKIPRGPAKDKKQN